MQRTEEIDVSALEDIVNSIFQETAIAYQDYSSFDSALKKYKSAESVLAVIEQAILSNDSSLTLQSTIQTLKDTFWRKRKF